MENLLPSWFDAVWNMVILQQSVQQWTIALGVFLGVLIIVKLFRRIVLHKFEIYAQRTAANWDNELAKTIRHISKVFYLLLALFITVEFYLNLIPAVEQLVRAAFIVSLAYETLMVVQSIMYYSLAQSKLGKNKTSLQGVKMVANIALWAIGVLMVLDNLNFDISALAASLGIGGIAIALAAQSILGDLFSSFTIYFDKPFQVGDYIVLGDHEGTVKKIGLKTTRIESLSGEELIVSNTELTSTRIRNYKKMKRRRMTLLFGVTYDTKPEKLESIPQLVETIISEVGNGTFDRCHFKQFGSSSLDFECIYHIEEGGKTESMRVQQEINFALFRAFSDKGIQMAFPTQTVYVKKD